MGASWLQASGGESASLLREEEGDDLVQIPYSCLSFHTFIGFLISCFFIFCFSLRPFLEALNGCLEGIIFNSTIGEGVSRVSQMIVLEVDCCYMYFF